MARALVLVGVCVWLFPTVASVGQEAGQGGRQRLLTAVQEMASGRFDAARGKLAGIEGTFSGNEQAIFRGAKDLLVRYEALMLELDESYVAAYRDHSVKMTKAVDQAHWREALIAGSRGYEGFEGETKAAFEEETAEQIAKDWQSALAQVAVMSNLAERTGIAETIDVTVRDDIVAEALEIARGHEIKEEWFEAYTRIYYYLTSLEKANQQWEDHARRLLRQASLVGMYVQDPNQESISWQERREGITFEIIRRGLDNVRNQYVDQPVDFQEMVERGLAHCLYLADTSKLAETFSKLQDETLREAYRDGILKLITEIKAKAPEQVNHTQVLVYMRKVLALNEASLLIPEEVMMGEYAEGAFSALDGYTYLIWPSDVADFQKDMTNEFTGIGIEISMVNGLLTVASLLEGNPAEKAGLDAGDVIMKIDDKPTNNITMEMAVHRITGPAKTKVVLTIDRKGFDEPRDFVVTRDHVVVQTVKGLYRNEAGNWEYYLDREKGIAYVQVKSFSGETTASLERVLDRLDRQGLDGLVLDLRANSGGYLSAAVGMVDFFVSRGRIVVTKPRGYDNQATRSGSLESLRDVALVVLADKSSASASEIVSGALKDHGRGLVVGTRTFGKGNVQTIQDLRGGTGAQMKMTIAYYYLPNGRRVHRDPMDKLNEDYGVAPDMTIELTNEQMDKRRQVFRDASVLHRTDQREEATWQLYSAEEMLASDPQLRAALLCMEAELLEHEATRTELAELTGAPGRDVN